MPEKLKCEHCGQAIPHSSGIVADRDRGEIRFRDHVAYLPPHEFEMFAVLLDRIGRVVSKETFLTMLYQLEDEEPDMKIVDVYICKMRAKMKAMEFSIKTYWARGYSLEVPKQQDGEPNGSTENSEALDNEAA